MKVMQEIRGPLPIDSRIDGNVETFEEDCRPRIYLLVEFTQEVCRASARIFFNWPWTILSS